MKKQMTDFSKRIWLILLITALMVTAMPLSLLSGEGISYGAVSYTHLDVYKRQRLHEAGVASNRGSECHGECVPGSCTHRPSHHGSWGAPEVGQEIDYLRRNQ